MIKFEDYNKILCDRLSESLCSFPASEVQTYFNNNQEWVKDSYKSYCEKTIDVDSAINSTVYAMSLDF